MRTAKSWKILSLIFLLLSLTATIAKPAKVQFQGDLERKFPNIQRVLNTLVETLERKDLWDQDVLLQRVPVTGKFVNYRLVDIVGEFHGYLTDGKLTLIYKPNHPKSNVKAAASTARPYRIALHNKAGSWDGKDSPYSDYLLARTIFHELVHIWQIRNGTAPTLIGSKETSAYFIEPHLPKDLFDLTEYPDPGGTNPVPSQPTPPKAKPSPPKAVPTSLSFDGLFADDGSATVQCSVGGIPAGSPVSVSYRGRLLGPGVNRGLNGAFPLPGGGYHGKSIPIPLGSAASPGIYTVELELFLGHLTTRARKDTFERRRKTPDAPTPSPSSSPTLPPLEAEIVTPLETVVGEDHIIQGRAKGGSGSYSFSWMITEVGAHSGAKVKAKFGVPGSKIVTLTVIDQKDSSAKPSTTTTNILVNPKLDVQIDGPAKVPLGERAQLTARPTGGLPPYKYKWTSASGKTSSSPTISGVVRGNVGDKKTVSLGLEDSRGEKVNDKHEFLVTKPHRLEISKIDVFPRVIDRGSSAEVVVQYSVPKDGNYQIQGRFETSSGSGRGAKDSKNVSAVAGKTLVQKFRFRTAKDGKPGPLSIRVRLMSGAGSLVKGTTATLRLPVDVDKAGQNDFVGTYNMSDPKRSWKDYRGIMKLGSRGRAKSRERVNGKLLAGNGSSKSTDGYHKLTWSYKDKKFILDFTAGGKWGGGYFSGTVSGNTKDFKLQGTWNNGTAGTLRMTKR